MKQEPYLNFRFVQPDDKVTDSNLQPVKKGFVYCEFLFFTRC